MQLNTNYAFKEWAVAIDALEQGRMIMLLRKGGIHEQNGRFKVAHDRTLLYPTYEHQQPSLLKSDYASLVQPVASGWHPETVRIGSWASVTDILPVTESAVVQALLPFHVWNEQFICDRLRWKPKQPLYILLLRTYKLAQAQIIPYHSEYGGCKSWIDLAGFISITDALPVLSDTAYTHLVAEIRGIIGNNSYAPSI